MARPHPDKDLQGLLGITVEIKANCVGCFDMGQKPRKCLLMGTVVFREGKFQQARDGRAPRIKTFLFLVVFFPLLRHLAASRRTGHYLFLPRPLCAPDQLRARVASSQSDAPLLSLSPTVAVCRPVFLLLLWKRGKGVTCWRV